MSYENFFWAKTSVAFFVSFENWTKHCEGSHNMRVIDVRITWVSNYKKFKIGHPRDRALISWQIGATWNYFPPVPLLPSPPPKKAPGTIWSRYCEKKKICWPFPGKLPCTIGMHPRYCHKEYLEVEFAWKKKIGYSMKTVRKAEQREITVKYKTRFSKHLIVKSIFPFSMTIN